MTWHVVLNFLLVGCGVFFICIGFCMHTTRVRLAKMNEKIDAYLYALQLMAGEMVMMAKEGSCDADELLTRTTERIKEAIRAA